MAAALALCLLLAGCSLTPNRIEIAASSAGRDCAKGCVHVTPRRAQIRFSF